MQNHAEVHGQGPEEVEAVVAFGRIAMAHRLYNDGFTTNGENRSEAF